MVKLSASCYRRLKQFVPDEPLGLRSEGPLVQDCIPVDPGDLVDLLVYFYLFWIKIYCLGVPPPG